MTRSGLEMVYPKNKEVLPGPETTYASLGARWANVANTPFRYWKAKSYEGGICTPMNAHWPKGMNRKSIGGFNNEYGHVMDIIATCVDLAEAEHPEILARMIEAYDEWTRRCMVVPYPGQKK